VHVSDSWGEEEELLALWGVGSGERGPGVRNVTGHHPEPALLITLVHVVVPGDV
jgi:hypothetical protein